jgi:hypothetical protein
MKRNVLWTTTHSILATLGALHPQGIWVTRRSQGRKIVSEMAVDTK